MSYMSTYRHFRPETERIIQALAAEHGGEVFERRDDEYGWCLEIGEPPNALGISLMLEDAIEYEGEEMAGWGNFSLMVVEFGGRILGQLTPHNYTPEVWVRLAPSGWPELQSRLDFIESADIGSLIREWAAKEGK